MALLQIRVHLLFPLISWVLDSEPPLIWQYQRQISLSFIDNIHPVNIVDDISSTVHEKGNVHVTSFLSLDDVYMFLNFLLGIQSISKLTTQNHCCAIFYPTYYVFHDCRLGWGLIRVVNMINLYYLDDGTLHSNLVAISPSDTPLKWHHWLGHPSQLMRQVLPSSLLFSL